MTDTDCEPMDIDSSANTSYTAMEISYNEVDEAVPIIQPKVEHKTQNHNSVIAQNVQEVKKFHIDIRPIRAKRNMLNSNQYILFCFAASVFISILCYTAINFSCYNEINARLLKESLTAKVYGQSEALESLIRALEVNASGKILFLYGGTGVGKTLSMSVLLDNLPNFTNVYHYTMPSFVDKFTTDLNLGYIFCDKWIIIVDDVHVGDKHIKPVIKEIIEKNENLRKNVTIILVYNCDNISNEFVKECDNSFLIEIQKEFKDVKALKYFMRYVPLTEDILKQCIKNELEDRLIRKIDVSFLLKKFNVAHDGCKGVHTKIRSLNIF